MQVALGYGLGTHDAVIMVWAPYISLRLVLFTALTGPVIAQAIRFLRLESLLEF